MSTIFAHDALYCPYCRFRFEDSPFLGQGNDTTDCPACGREFDYSIDASVTAPPRATYASYAEPGVLQQIAQSIRTNQ